MTKDGDWQPFLGLLAQTYAKARLWQMETMGFFFGIAARVFLFWSTEEDPDPNQIIGQPCSYFCMQTVVVILFVLIPRSFREQCSCSAWQGSDG